MSSAGGACAQISPVGLWGVFLGQPAIWVLPIVLPLVMALGGAFGMIGVPVSAVETGIALSAVALGLCVALAQRTGKERLVWIDDAGRGGGIGHEGRDDGKVVATEDVAPGGGLGEMVASRGFDLPAHRRLLL